MPGPEGEGELWNTDMVKGGGAGKLERSLLNETFSETSSLIAPPQTGPPLPYLVFSVAHFII